MRPATALSAVKAMPSQRSTPHRAPAAYSTNVVTGSTAAAHASAVGRRWWPKANAAMPRPMHRNPKAELGTMTRHPGTTAAGVA